MSIIGRAPLAIRGRAHPGYVAFLLHRLSGLALALFLPFHFLVLGLAVSGEATLNSFLRWTDRPLVRLSETMLVLLLAAHLGGGIRLLAVEFLSWSNRQARWIAASGAFALASGGLFLLRVFT